MEVDTARARGSAFACCEATLSGVPPLGREWTNAGDHDLFWVKPAGAASAEAQLWRDGGTHVEVRLWRGREVL